jgi:hypothetical protein
VTFNRTIDGSVLTDDLMFHCHIFFNTSTFNDGSASIIWFYNWTSSLMRHLRSTTTKPVDSHLLLLISVTVLQVFTVLVIVFISIYLLRRGRCCVRRHKPIPNEFSSRIIAACCAGNEDIATAEASQPLLTTPEYTLHCSSDKGNKVRGICVMRELLYVIREGQSEVQVYDRLSLKLLGLLPASDDKYPGCMTLHADDECLYITYYISKTIRRVPLYGKNPTEWKTSSEPDGICVAANSSNVIVAMREADKLVEFTPLGNVLKEISLPSGTKPRTVLSIRDDALYVCTGYGDGYVCVLERDGALRQIVSKTSHPLDIAIDLIGNMLVADYDGGKVVLLDSATQYVTEAIPATEGLEHPFKLCFDDKCKMLYAAELWDNGRVLAYKVNYSKDK